MTEPAILEASGREASEFIGTEALGCGIGRGVAALETDHAAGEGDRRRYAHWQAIE